MATHGVHEQQEATRAVGGRPAVNTDPRLRYNPSELKQQVGRPDCIVSYRTASDHGRGDQVSATTTAVATPPAAL